MRGEASAAKTTFDYKRSINSPETHFRRKSYDGSSFPGVLRHRPSSQQAAAAPASIPVDAFVDEDKYSQPRLSPDGKHVALNVRIARNGRTIPTMTVYSLPALRWSA